jgi:peptidyl-prolyl cis-trans isomerase C
MIHLTKTALIAVALLSVAVVHAAPNTMSFNGIPVPQAQFDAILKTQIIQGKSDTPELRNDIKKFLAGTQIIVREAEKMNLGKNPDVVKAITANETQLRAQLAVLRDTILRNAYEQEYVKTHPVTDDALQSAYDNLRKAAGDKEYKVRHILVDSENQAKDIITRLNAGAKFDDLAKESKDSTRDRGGDLGWASSAVYAKPFADAVVALEKGKYTATPVQTNFGWHVILLEDTRELKFPAFEEIKPQLTPRVQQQMLETHLNELFKKAGLEDK